MDAYLLAAISVLIAAYAQWRVPRHTLASRVVGTRLLLVLLGLGVGMVSARIAMASGLAPVAPFLLGFGVVHVPAAIVLFLKGQHGEGRT